MSSIDQIRERMPAWATVLGDYSDAGEYEPDGVVKPAAGPPQTPATGAAVDAAELRRALKIVKPALNTSSTIQALLGVLVKIDGQPGSLTCDSMDGACQAPVCASGSIEMLVSHAALTAAVFDADGVVSLTTGQDEATVSFGQTTVELRQFRREDFPAQTFDGTAIFTGDRKLADTIVAASVSTSHDEIRPVLCGVYLDGGHDVLVATDSFRMFVAPLPNAGWDGAVLASARPLVAAVKDAEEFTVKLTEPPGRQALLIARPDRTWRVPIIDGQFPAYSKLIPDECAGRVSFVRKDAARAVARAARMLRSDTHPPVKLTFRTDRIKLAAEQPDVLALNDSIPATSVALAVQNEQQFGLDPRLLLEGLLSCGTSDRLELRYIAPLRPVLLVDGDVQYLLMPIRLN